LKLKNPASKRWDFLALVDTADYTEARFNFAIKKLVKIVIFASTKRFYLKLLFEFSAEKKNKSTNSNQS